MALGTHSIPVELLKHGGEEVMNKIHKLVGIIQEKERIPEEWKLSIIYQWNFSSMEEKK